MLRPSQRQRPLTGERGKPPQPGGSRIQTVTVDGLPRAAWLFASWSVTTNFPRQALGTEKEVA